MTAPEWRVAVVLAIAALVVPWFALESSAQPRGNTYQQAQDYKSELEDRTFIFRDRCGNAMALYLGKNRRSASYVVGRERSGQKRGEARRNGPWGVRFSGRWGQYVVCMRSMSIGSLRRMSNSCTTIDELRRLKSYPGDHFGLTRTPNEKALLGLI